MIVGLIGNNKLSEDFAESSAGHNIEGKGNLKILKRI